MRSPKKWTILLINKMFWTRKFDVHCKRFVGDLGWRLMKGQFVSLTKQVDEKILYWRGKDIIRRSHTPEEAVFCAIRDFAEWYYREHFDKRERNADFVEDCRTIASTLSILHEYVDQQRFLIPTYWKTFDERMKADWKSSAFEAPAIDEVVISSSDIDECWNDLIDDLADDAPKACYEAILKASLDAARVSEKTGVALEIAKLWLETFCVYGIASKDSSGTRFGQPVSYRAVYFPVTMSAWSEPPKDHEKRQALVSLGVLDDFNQDY